MSNNDWLINVVVPTASPPEPPPPFTESVLEAALRYKLEVLAVIVPLAFPTKRTLPTGSVVDAKSGGSTVQKVLVGEQFGANVSPG